MYNTTTPYLHWKYTFYVGNFGYLILYVHDSQIPTQSKGCTYLKIPSSVTESSVAMADILALVAIILPA